VLVQQLGELESVGVVYRVIHDTIPMKTEYFLTELGESLVPIIRMMDNWGNEHRSMFNEMGPLD
jgi:DNA-binding HxlR family transcriptional regulator